MKYIKNFESNTDYDDFFKMVNKSKSEINQMYGTNENLSNVPKVGDYCIYTENTDYLKNTLIQIRNKMKYCANNIGEIISIEYGVYIIRYDNVKYDLLPHTFDVNTILKNIKFFSSDKNDCEAYLNAQEYNL